MLTHREQQRIESVLAGQFKTIEGVIYLNHAAISPWPVCTTKAVMAFAEENSAEGPEGYRHWLAREHQLRRGLATLLNAGSPADIALLKNTTEGICTVAFGLDLQPGDNIVLPRDEFPSNCLPWLAQAERGVEIRQVDIRQAEDAEAALLGAMDDRTRLLATSAVQWTDGFRLDLEQLGQGCRQRGVLFFVDAIQQLGALQLDVETAHIDFLAADAHKWLLGPEGVAVFFTTAPARAQLKLLQQGWHALQDHWVFDGDAPVTDTARRFEAGSPNSLGQAAMHASLRLLLDAGMLQVEQRVLQNTARLFNGLENIPGIELCSRQDPGRRSGIVSFRHRTKSVDQLHDDLQAMGLRCSLRNAAIRLSPHFYQGEDCMDRVLEKIEEACN
ncbi:MAG TPA: aminotransferase class V-fold PLP-dependent enzyme [Xanthomonadales bacterium]|nr:aminotransferase class V-fold PLP-dependent enzyme [Xanthomonadales bacterium]